MTTFSKEDLLKECVTLYDAAFSVFTADGMSETDAQRSAISSGFEQALKRFGLSNAKVLWQAIQSAHVKRKSGKLIDAETIAAVSSAVQSWAKSSGHAFEQTFCKLMNEQLAKTSIRFMLQREVNVLIQKKALANKERDLGHLSAWIASSAFDVFALLDNNDGTFTTFGCVQCKTSIRDRVGRDREPSLQAMKDFFWSISVVINGDFLLLPKFNAMVNGGTSDYHSNGWHGMYAYSDCDADRRIYLMDDDMAPLTDHALRAAESWQNDRQWFNSDWGPPAAF